MTTENQPQPVDEDLIPIPPTEPQLPPETKLVNNLVDDNFIIPLNQKHIEIMHSYTSWYEQIVQQMHILAPALHTSILNLGSGTRPPLESVTNASKVEVVSIVNVEQAQLKKSPEVYKNYSDNNESILSFMEGVPDQEFNHIISCRYFEHIPCLQLDYYLYLMHRIMKPNGYLTFVVPDFIKLGKALVHLDKKFDYQKWITLNYEFFHDKEDAHSCLWTTEIAEKLLSGQGYFNNITIKPINIDGMHWYIEVVAQKQPKCLFPK